MPLFLPKTAAALTTRIQGGNPSTRTAQPQRSRKHPVLDNRPLLLASFFFLLTIGTLAYLYSYVNACKQFNKPDPRDPLFKKIAEILNQPAESGTSPWDEITGIFNHYGYMRHDLLSHFHALNYFSTLNVQETHFLRKVLEVIFNNLLATDLISHTDILFHFHKNIRYDEWLILSTVLFSVVALSLTCFCDFSPPWSLAVVDAAPREMTLPEAVEKMASLATQTVSLGDTLAPAIPCPVVVCWKHKNGTEKRSLIDLNILSRQLTDNPWGFHANKRQFVAASQFKYIEFYTSSPAKGPIEDRPLTFAILRNQYGMHYFFKGIARGIKDLCVLLPLFALVYFLYKKALYSIDPPQNIWDWPTTCSGKLPPLSSNITDYDTICSGVLETFKGDVRQSGIVTHAFQKIQNAINAAFLQEERQGKYYPTPILILGFMSLNVFLHYFSDRKEALAEPSTTTKKQFVSALTKMATEFKVRDSDRHPDARYEATLATLDHRLSDDTDLCDPCSQATYRIPVRILWTNAEGLEQFTTRDLHLLLSEQKKIQTSTETFMDSAGGARAIRLITAVEYDADMAKKIKKAAEEPNAAAAESHTLPSSIRHRR